MKIYRKMLPGLICLMLCAVLLLPAGATGETLALFINVGKADAALFFLDDARFLIDTGTKDSLDHLLRVLEAYDVTHLDGILVTHTDKDHAGGLKKLLKNGIQVDMLYAGTLHSEESVENHRVYEASEKHDVPLTWLSAGQELTVGNAVLKVLGPLAQDSENENNNSLVIRMETPDGSLLLTGDMELDEENQLRTAGLFAPADVLKVPHHGEDDATSRVFALMIKPQWAVISTNTAQEPDTPDPKVLSYLQQAGASIAVTQDTEVGVMITLADGVATAEAINWQ